jgi:hypothetical protein
MDLTLGMVSLRFYLNISQDNQELILHKYPYNISDKLVSFYCAKNCKEMDQVLWHTFVRQRPPQRKRLAKFPPGGQETRIFHHQLQNVVNK